MGFIRNFEIWSNQRPRVCSFDIPDYCDNWGNIGNTCTGNQTAPNMGSESDPFTTSRATADAWFKAVVEYFLASINFYNDPSYFDPTTYEFIIPEGLLNEKCNPRSKYDELCNLFYGYPHGFYYTRIAFISKKMQINNSFMQNGDPAKRTGVHTFTEFISTAPRVDGVTYTYTVDFTDYQEPNYNHYLEFRAILGDLMQLFKKVLTATADHPLTSVEIPPICSGDIVIGDQTWSQCNLSVTTYRNGDPIPYVEDPVEWAALTTGAWCYYDNNPDTEPALGKLYNWYAVNDPRGLAPEGYHIPTRYEWQTLIDTTGGNETAGIALKQVGRLDRTCTTAINASYWQYAPITRPTNSSFFTALPGGIRTGTAGSSSSFDDLGLVGYWWSSTETDLANSSYMYLEYSTNEANNTFSTGKIKGMSVRVLKDPTCADDVTIGSQVWTRCNLGVTTYRNGDIIPQVTDPTEWTSLTTGAWCYYNNDPLTEPVYGKLYNWYAVNDPRGLAIDGYHIPTEDEFGILSYYLGGDNVAGGKLKEVGLSHWLAPNTDATNESGFTALPGGDRFNFGNFEEPGTVGSWWSSTEYMSTYAYCRSISNETGSFPSGNAAPKFNGLSVRLIKGPAICTEVKIGYQTWSTCNLNVETYRNGDPIPYVGDPTEWENLTTGAWCYYNNDPTLGLVYGKLYNWYAVNDPRGLAPEGYKIPTDNDWTVLTNELNGPNAAGGKLKQKGFAFWNAPNQGGTNSSGFRALPGGFRTYQGEYDGIKDYAFWWSSTNIDIDYARNYNLETTSAISYKNSNLKTVGLSVRVLKEDLPCNQVDVIIGTQTWTGCNLSVDTYRNGDPIPYVDDPAVWVTLNTGAWCYYNNDPSTEPSCGRLYNAHAVNDPRGLAPIGYHIPSTAESEILINYLGGSTVAGGKLKDIGTDFWNSPNTGATNSSGFRALAVGERSGIYSTNGFANRGIRASFWNSDLGPQDSNGILTVMYNDNGASTGLNYKRDGLAVRLIKDTSCITDMTIGTQVWQCSNLNVDTYRNGDPIPQVTDPALWGTLTTGAWCYHNNDPATGAVYGKLYNWHAVNDPRGLASPGYHIPTKTEWLTLQTYLGGQTVAGVKMKEEGTAHWLAPNYATNSSLFTGLPGGHRHFSGSYAPLGYSGLWWSSTESGVNNAWNSLLDASSSLVMNLHNKVYGLSVRLIKDELPQCEVTIGTQIWTCKNLDVATYRNGDIIPQVTDLTEWSNLTTGAWCYYNNDPSTEETYGKLYNWYAVNDPRGLALDGWHIPTDAEWTTLTDYLGGNIVAGGKLKEAGFQHWVSPNTGATNEFYFTGLPGGYRDINGDYNSIGSYSYWWSSTENDTDNAWFRNLNSNASYAVRTYYFKRLGLSIRLVKD